MLNTGDMTFMMVASALVMLMTPGLALFYGGLVRSKNVLGTLLQSYICLGLVSVLWFAFGYSLCFGPDLGGFIGSLKWVGLREVGLNPGPYATTIPHILFCTFQLMFAIITPALITGAFAERMRFSSFLLFTTLWVVLVYFPVCHWIWGGGWLSRLGVLDFAGGTVIHVNSGVAALAAALVVGKRRGFKREPLQPHNLPLTIAGAGLLWFGWFGFNAGSALAADKVAVAAFFNTHIAAAVATFTWLVVEWKMLGKPTMLGAATGSLAGLAAVTNAAGFVPPFAAVLIGLTAGIVCYGAIILKERLGFDDSLDVVGVHGVGGVLGALATGLFASTRINPGGGNGLFFGNAHQFLVQVVAVAVTLVFSFVMTVVILKVVDALTKLRVSDEEEIRGLDLTQHSETGYGMS